jgi:hypothetical protein
MINPSLPRDIRQVRLPCRVDPRDLPQGVTKIDEVYVTDLSSATHICSAERMSWLVGIRSEFTFVDGLSEERQEELSNLESESCPEDDYFPMRDISALPSVRFEDDKDDTDEEALEAAREYFQGNFQ